MNSLEKIKGFLGKYSKAIVAVLFAVLLIIIVILYTRGPKVKVVQKGNSDIEQKTTIRKDINDNILYELKATIMAKNESDARNDSLAKALKLSKKNIKEVTVIHTVIDTVFKEIPITMINDTLYRLERKDAWVDIVAEVGKEKGKIEYSSRDSLYLVQSVKNPLFGPTKRTLTIRSANPYNKVLSGYSYTIEEKKSIFDIGLYAGYGWNGQKFAPSAGIAVTKPLISFKK